MGNKLYTISKLVLKISSIFAFIVGFFFYINRGIGNGDEWHFINDLKIINENGWIFAIEKKISIPYMILVYPFSFILPQEVVYRFVNILAFIGLLIYFYKLGAIKNKLFYFYFLFYCSTGCYIIGTNDVIFFVFMTIFFNEAYKIFEKKENYSVSLMLSSLVIFAFTREMFIIFLPIIFLTFFLLYKSKINWKHKIQYPIAIFIFFSILNIPSLIKNNSLSYDNKQTPEGVTATWGQRQYLAQLMVNSGTLENKQHPSWEVTDAYLKKNGVNSLPISTFNGMFFDIKLTIKEFFKDFKDIIKDSIRQESIILLVVLFYLFHFIYKNKKITLNLFLPFCFFLMCSIFSFIIISYIETRWLISMFILAIIYFSDLEFYKKISAKVFIVNNFLIATIVVYGFYKIAIKI